MLSSKKIGLHRDFVAGVNLSEAQNPIPPLDVSVLQLPVLPLNVSLLHQSVLCAVCLFYISLSCPGCVCVSVLHQSVLSLDVSVLH